MMLYCCLVMSTMLASVLSQSNLPPFFANAWFWEMDENEALGSRPRSAITHEEIELHALDGDSDQDELRYAVTGTIGSRYFTVDAVSGMVKLRKPFDREVDDKYTAKFTVTDGVNTVEHEAEIRIIDVNDNSPTFDRDRYIASISEHATIGTEVIRISASDPDTGFGGAVTYSLEEENASPFQLDGESGILTLTETIDFESISEYRLSVVAQDSDILKPLSSTTTVYVNVEDVQDTAPIFYKLPYDRRIKEDIDVGTSVVCVTALDGDRGTANEIIYSLVSGNEEGNFLFSTASGEIRTARPIDRDREDFAGVYSLTVRAIELFQQESTLGDHKDISFDIIVDDVNDERAQFEQRSYRLSVSENQPSGTSLPIVIPVLDIDQGPNCDVTMSVSWDVSDLISVSPVTFSRKSDVTLVLKRELDYEKQKRIRFKLFANETNNPGLYSSCDVIIDVENENDNEPIFQQNVYSVNVSENAALHETILRVTATDADLGRYGQVVYSVDSNQGEISINKTTGDVQLLAKLDHEKEQTKRYVITARDGVSSPHLSRTLLTINVQDVDDNAPVFDDLPTLRVAENRRYSGLAIVKARDRDSYPHDVITYAIEGGALRHRFTMETSENGTGLLNLIEPLDFESIDDGRSELTISASSGNMRTTATLVVIVEDQNDHRPKFLQASDLAVLENIGGGTTIGSVRAEDRDSGNNGDVFYYVTKGQQMFYSVFRLNEATGYITTKPGVSLDHETVSRYNITVTAEDAGNPPLSSETSFNIDVIDANDNPPQFGQPVYHFTMLENSSPRDLRVSATDEDSGNNAVIRYAITGGNAARLFVIDDVSGQISVRRKIDYEERGGSLTLIVQAQDMGTEPLTSTTTVRISLTDVNDNAPRFLQANRTNFYVAENVAGPVIATFDADDADSGKNARLVYSIVAGKRKELFSISPLDGELRVRHGTELDREEQEAHNLTIRVVDRGLPQLSAKLNITVTVTDDNDNAPTFVDLPNRVNLSENCLIGFLAFRLVARDPDAGKFGKIVYSLMSLDNQFTVNSKDGSVYLARPLDREETREYILRVTARDNPENPKKSRNVTKSVLIVVDDVNDNVPRFVGVTPYRATITENSPPGTQVTVTGDNVLAIDDDEGDNARVTYSLRDDPTSLFAIDSHTGQIRTTGNIDRETLRNDVIELTVVASNEDIFTSEVAVVITIEDVNDNAPRFDNRRSRTRVLENVQPGHVVVRLTASDPDKGKNGQILYRIQSGAFDKFSIESKSGTIFLVAGQSLDREITSQYTLTIIATDQAPIGPRSNTCVVVVTVDDVNDARPKFFNNFQRISVKENSPVFTKVAQLVAADDDLNAQLTYTMTSATIYDSQGRPLVVDASVYDIMQSDNDVILGWFQLNSTSGEITLASNDLQAQTTVDRELCSSIHLKFIVQDEASANEEMANSVQPMTLQVDIIDENDNSPTIELQSPKFSKIGDDVIVDITEECEVATTLATLTAQDSDQGSNGKVIFELLDHTQRLVELPHETSGEILSLSRIDRERLAPFGGDAWINVTIVARDLGFPSSRSNQTKLRMRVKDINDNAPQFRRPEYQVNIHEDAPARSIVTSVKATDADDGNFGDVTYKLTGARSPFGIHPKKGTIYVRSALDRETANEYIVYVVATDNMKGDKDNRQQTTVQVTIHVTDINDNAPIFVQPLPSPLQVFEGTSTGTSVARVTAIDADEGIHGHVTYSLHSSSDFFAIDPFTGDVTLSRNVKASQHHPTGIDLTIVATDGGGREANATIHVKIVDINDHAPQFAEPSFEVVRIAEEQPGGTFVTQVAATDDDVGLNAVVRYALVESDPTTEQAFLIDDVTGRIVTSRRLDRELRKSYALHIQAYDLGEPRHHTSKLINVILDDVNDNRPAFPRNDVTGAHQTIHVTENAKPGTVIGSILPAVDRDERPKIFYHILSHDGSSEWRQTFRIEKDRIVVNRAIDREHTSRYILTIGATNNPNLSKPLPFQRWDSAIGLQTPIPAPLSANRIEEPLSLLWDPSRDSSLLRLSIIVDDVIDEKPRFSRQRYVTAVEANAKIGTVLTKLNATDSDADDIVTYHLVSCQLLHPDNSRTTQRHDFVINKNDGVVMTTASLRGRKGRYVLEVVARDSANLTATAILEVRVRQKSTQLKFVINSPPGVVAEQQDKLTEVLSNVTRSIISVDAIQYHVTPSKQRDVCRSDVTIRVFDAKQDLKPSLERGSKQLGQIFGDHSFYELQENKDVTRSDFMIFRTVISIFVVVLLLVIIIFIFCFVHMRRKYRKELKILKEQRSRDNSIQVSSEGKSPESAGSSKSERKQTPKTFHPPPRIVANKVRRSVTTDAPALAGTLLWSPSAMRRTTRSLEVGDSPQMTRRDVFLYDGMTLHAAGYDKPSLTPLHGSDSGSSF